MERSLKRRPKDPKPGTLKQSTIHSLKRVVVMEDIKRWKCILEFPQQSRGNLLETLQQLKKKIPSEEVILSTKIGEAVQNLQGHSDAEVSQLAQEIHTQWETFIRQNHSKANIEVRSDAATEKLRSSARRLLCEALHVEVGDALAECIEHEVFYQCSRLINMNYRRTVRTLVFTLKHKPEICCQLKDRLLQVKELVQKYKK